MGLASMMKRPSAFLPVVMSLAAVITVAVALTSSGVDAARQQPDEGTAAHLWQLLVGGQLPIVAFFAMKWLPQAPREALAVLSLQAAAGLAALAPVYFLHL